MFEREIILYDFMLRYATVLLADVDDGVMTDQPFAAANHPAWILGHLRVAEDAGLRMLGVESDCPATWYDLFEPGTLPHPERARYPSKAELFERLGTGHAALRTAVANATAEELAADNGNEVLRPHLPTLGDVLAHAMTTHPAMHCGQLAAWRRAMGLPVVTPPPKLR